MNTASSGDDVLEEKQSPFSVHAVDAVKVLETDLFNVLWCNDSILESIRLKMTENILSLLR